jgi:hypothetical protein
MLSVNTDTIAVTTAPMANHIETSCTETPSIIAATTAITIHIIGKPRVPINLSPF